MTDLSPNKSALIGAGALYKMMHDHKVKVIDASYGLQLLPVRIGNAIDFDIDKVAAPGAPLPHTLPSAEIFAAHVARMGIGNDDTIVIYDRNGIHMAAARVWWMFRVFGHDNVYILDGGLPAWVGEGMPVLPKMDPDEPSPDTESGIEPATYRATFRPHLFKKLQDMTENLKHPDFTVVDVRDPARYRGDAPEGRPNMQGGHIPGSINIPFADMIDHGTGLLKNKQELKDIFDKSGLNLQHPVALSCGSGVTACVVALALHEIGAPDAAVYGGSWAEWGTDPALPKNKGGQP